MSASPEKSGANEPGAAKPKRWWRVVFGLSLALNLLVIGAVASFVLQGPKSRGGPPGPRDVSAPYVITLERADKRALRRDMRARLPARDEARAAHAADYAAFAELLRAEEFDASAATALIDGQMQRAARAQTLGRTLMLERIADMSQSARSAYADRLESWLKNRKARPDRRERRRPKDAE